jgi:signal transduction histidine kinase/sensor domain CHASE-containing protein
VRLLKTLRAWAPAWVSIAAGLAIVAICAQVILGWILQDLALVQIRPGWPKMQLGSALALVALAAAMVSVAVDRRRLGAILGVLPFALGIATVLEHATGLPLDLQHLIRQFPALTSKLNPGMLSQGTAIAFISGSMAVWLLVQRRQQPTLVAITAGVPLVIGSVAMFAHSMGVDTLYGANPLLLLAFHTSASCTLLGVGLLAHNWRVSTVQDRGVPLWVPVSAGVMLSLLTLMLWLAVRDRENMVRREEAAAAVSSLRDAIEQDLNTRVESYERMAARLAVEGGTTEDWSRDAELYIRHSHDPYATLIYLDATLVPTAVAPQQSIGLPSREAVLGSRSIYEAIQDAQVNRTAAISGRFEIAPGVAGFVIATPVHAGDLMTGVLLAELAYEPILTRLLKRSPYSIRVLSGGTLLYSHGDDADNMEVTPLTLNVASDAWQLEVGPSRTVQRWQASRLSSGVLWFGLLLSIAVGIAAYLVRRNQLQSSAIEDANAQLSFEIEQRRRTEAQWRLTSTLQRAILDSTSHAVISTDLDGMIQTFNHAAEEMLGYTAEELVGVASPLLLHDTGEIADRAQTLSLELETPIAPGLDALVARARTGEVDRREWTYVRKTASRFPVELSISGMFDEQNTLTGFVATAVDITDRRHAELLRKWAEDSLRRTEALLHSVLDASLNGVTAFRAVRGENGAISDFECLLGNPAAERLLGQPPGTMVGRSFRELSSPEDEDALFHMCVAVVETGLPLDVEHFSTKYGNRWFRVVATRLDDGMALSFEDVTRRKEMDEELARYLADVERSRDQIHEQSVMLQWQADAVTKARDEALAGSRELERALKMQADFVSFASHQLRTPLAGIKWLLELALEEPEESDELRSYLADSLASAERLIGLVNDLLDVSRLEGGRMVPQLKPVDLSECCRDVAESLQTNVDIARHSLTMDGLDMPHVVSGDPQLIKQIIANLLSNAIKYTPPGGQMGIAVTSDQTLVRFAIEDSGLGVPPEARPRLFEKFFRADNVTTIETEGTGLGLYMVQLILQKFGGRIWYEPREDAPGSRFVFELPTQKETECHVNVEADSDRGGRPCPAPGL